MPYPGSASPLQIDSPDRDELDFYSPQAERQTPRFPSHRRKSLFEQTRHCVFQYNDSYNDQILCFANSIPNADGGTHLTGFRGALTRSINQYAKANKILKDKDPALSGDDVREGIVCIISVKMPNPRFSSQTKDKLVNTEIEGVVS
ncbi:hypothetical protein N9240_00955, partial [Akkermansiaceae bacterium]|nr:hypothetical protein [Akkermansiaceae bacterium]